MSRNGKSKYADGKKIKRDELVGFSKAKFDLAYYRWCQRRGLPLLEYNSRAGKSANKKFTLIQVERMEKLDRIDREKKQV